MYIARVKAHITTVLLSIVLLTGFFCKVWASNEPYLLTLDPFDDSESNDTTTSASYVRFRALLESLAQQELISIRWVDETELDPAHGISSPPGREMAVVIEAPEQTLQKIRKIPEFINVIVSVEKWKGKEACRRAPETRDPPKCNVYFVPPKTGKSN